MREKVDQRLECVDRVLRSQFTLRLGQVALPVVLDTSVEHEGCAAVDHSVAWRHYDSLNFIDILQEPVL